MARLAEGFAALEEDRNSATEREAQTDPQGAVGAASGKARARRKNPHRQRGAVRDSDIKAAEKFAAEHGLAAN